MSRYDYTDGGGDTRVVEFPLTKTVQSQASEWLSVLDGDDPAPETIEHFKRWLSQSEVHRQEFEALLALWEEMNVLTQSVPPRQHLAASESGLLGQFRSWYGNKQGGVVACLLFLAVLMVGMIVVASRPAIYSTGVGEQRTVKLPDGTSVMLNTNSQLEVHYDNQRRRVDLKKGEAFFQIVHDPSRAFEVLAAEGVIRALGTAFTVNISTDMVEVVVAEGVVEIERPPSTQPVTTASENIADEHLSGAVALESGAATNVVVPATRVSAGTRAVYAGNNFKGVDLATVDEHELEIKLAWRHGVLVFDQEPLENVIKEMTRYTALKFVIPDKALREVKVGGVLSLGDTKSMLEALNHGFGIRSEEISPQLIYLVAIDKNTIH